MYPVVDGRDVLAKAARLAWQSLTGKGTDQDQDQKRVKGLSSSGVVEDEKREKISTVEDKSKNIDVISIS